MLLLYVLTIVATILLLFFVYHDLVAGQWIAKPLAAAGFVGVAITSGAFHSWYGRCVLVALVLSWCGDVLLIPKDSPRAFLAGLVSFLLGHVAYVVAFFARGVAPGALVAGLLLVLPPFALAWRWISPHVGTMRMPVLIYMVVISCMVAAAGATVAHHTRLAILTGAVLFYLSDLAVARQQFVTKSFLNPAIGLPLYFGGQLILASTVA